MSGPDDRPWEDWISPGELAELAHVTRHAVQGWMRSERRRGNQSGFRRHKRRVWISPKTVERYLTLLGYPRSDRVPPDYRPTKRWVAESRACSTWLRQQLRSGRGDVRTVRVRSQVFIHVEDARRLELEYLDRRPHRGWMSTQQVAERFGVGQSTVLRWAHMYDVDMRVARGNLGTRGDGRERYYLTPAQVRAYRAYVFASDAGHFRVPRVYRFLRRNGPTPIREIHERTGLGSKVVRDAVETLIREGAAREVAPHKPGYYSRVIGAVVRSCRAHEEREAA